MLNEYVLKTAGRSAALCLLVLFATAQAQITITRADIPSHLNDTFLYKRNSGIATVNVGSAGGPNSWTFDTATFAGDRQYHAVVDKNATPFGGLFPGANVAYATEGESTLVNAYTFFQLSDSEFDCEGMGLEFTDTLLHRAYQPHALAAPLPLTYEQSWQTSYAWTDTMPPIIVITQVRERHKVDAYGTVTTPSGTYPCLRENVLDTVITTVWYDSVPVTSESTWRRHYIWHAPLHGIAVSARGPERDTNPSFTSSDCYRVMVQVKAGIEEQSPTGASSPMPGATLVRGVLRLPEPLFRSPQSELTLLDLSGRTVLRIPRSTSASGSAVDVSGLVPGVYFLHQDTPDRRAVLQKYILVE